MCVHALHVCLTAGRLVAACLKAAKPPAPEPRSVEVPLPRFSVQAALTTICALTRWRRKGGERADGPCRPARALPPAQTPGLSAKSTSVPGCRSCAPGPGQGPAAKTWSRDHPPRTLPPGSQWQARGVRQALAHEDVVVVVFITSQSEVRGGHMGAPDWATSIYSCHSLDCVEPHWWEGEKGLEYVSMELRNIECIYPAPVPTQVLP